MDLRNYFAPKSNSKTAKSPVEEKPKAEPEKKRASSRRKTVIPDSDEDESPVEVESKHFASATPEVKKKQPVEETVNPKDFFASAKTKKSQAPATPEPTKATQSTPKKTLSKDESLEEPKEKAQKQQPVKEAPPVKRTKKADDGDYFEDDGEVKVVPKITKAKAAVPEPVKASAVSKKADAKVSNSRKRKSARDDYNDSNDDDDDDGYKDEDEKVGPSKKHKTTAKKTKDDSAMDIDEPEEEKPKAKFNYWAHKNKAGPSALGSKEIPKGQDNCLAGWTFVFTGELSSITREDATDLVKRYSGRVTGSPSGKTSFVIVGDGAGQSKIDKVKKLKIKTLDEDEFLDLIRTSPAKTEDGVIVKADSKSNSKSSAGGSGSSKVKAEPAASSSASMASKTSSSETLDATAITSDSNGSVQSELWTSKYRPMQVKDLCGNNAQIQKLQRWLEGWDDNYKLDFKKDNADKSGLFRAVLISGPPGIGKTSAAHLVGNSLGFNIVEFNASDTRSKKSLDEDVRVLLDNQSLAGYFQSSTQVEGKGKTTVKETDPSMAKKQLIIMDEVDGMAGGDRGGIAQLISFIKKTHRPQVNQVRSRLLSILHKEGRRIPANVLDKLVSGSQSDIRQVLNMLSTWSLTKQEMNYDEGTALSKASEKYVALNPFQIAEQLLVETNYRALSVADKFDMYFNDYQLAPLMIQENYVRMNPTDARNDSIDAIDLMSKAADSLSDADLVDTLIHGSAQHWSLMPTHAAFSCVRPSFYVHGNLRPGSGGQFGPMMQFPSFLGQNSKSSKFSRIVKELQIRMRLKISGDKNEVRQSYLPALFPALSKPLVRDGVDAIPDLIEFMDSYYLSKEDWDSVLELGIGRNDGKKVMDSIPSTTKSAFTRKYNSEAHPQPFLKSVLVTRARGGDSGRSDEVPDNLEVVDADAIVPEETNEAEEAAEEESIEKDNNIKQKKTKAGAKTKGKAKASSSRK
ncbi:hypothetical protein BGZ49_001536 [Haplosporangium sp. Z 27]|nr:hypothetical protein BGZ49_001536 [Haplosporangium sp. Z 27]